MKFRLSGKAPFVKGLITLAIVGAFVAATPNAALAWGKSQEGDTTNIAVDFSHDWSTATYIASALNPDEQARDGHFHIFGPGGHIADSDTKRWGPNERHKWQGKALAGSGKLICTEFWNTNNTRHGTPTCVKAG